MAALLRSLKYARLINVCKITRPFRIINTVSQSPLRVQSAAVFDGRPRTYATFSDLRNKNNKEKAAAEIERTLQQMDSDLKLNAQIPINNIKRLLKIFENEGKVSSAQALFLIRCCGESIAAESPKTREEMINDVWNILKVLNANLDVSHYNALLEAYLQANYNFSPLDFLIKMKNDNIEPNRVTYQRLIVRYCNQGDIDGATKILEYMSKNDLPINENIFSCLIRGHAESGDITSAVSMLSVMKDAGIEPKLATYSALLDAYAMEGDIDKIKSTLAECEEKEIVISDSELLSVLYTLTAKGHSQHVDEIINRMVRGMFYNRYAMWTMYKLIDIDQIDVALKLVTTLVRRKTDGKLRNSGGFFVKKLVNNNQSAEKIYSICQILEEKEIHDNTKKVALETSIRKGLASSVDLMTLWRNDGGEIREHFFYPVLLSHGKKGNYEGVLSTLKTMVNDFHILPRIDTLRAYFMPYAPDGFNEVVTTLMNLKIPLMTIKHTIILHYILEGKLHKVSEYLPLTTGPYMTRILAQPLAYTFAASGDAKSYVSILHHLYNDLFEKLDSEMKLETQHESAEAFLNNSLTFMVHYCTIQRTNDIIKVIDELVKKGMTISSEAAMKIQNKIGDKELTPIVSENLSKLTSGELTLKPVKSRSVSWMHNVNDVAHLERILSDRQKDNKPVDALQNKLLSIYCSNMDEPKVEALVQALKKENFKFNESTYAKLIDVYSTLGKMEQAEFWMNEFFKSGSNRTLDKAKILKYAILLVENGRIDDALKALEIRPRDEVVERPALTASLITKVGALNDDAVMNKFLTILKQKGFVLKFSNFLFSPMIKALMERGDITATVDAFQSIAKTHSLAPMKLELMKHLIKDENSKELQRVTDTVTLLYGEPDAVISLAMAFFECQRYQQAKKILQTPGLYVFKDKLMFFADKYIEEGNAETLERFSELFKNIHPEIIVKVINPKLLELYKAENDCEKALALWTQMQEDNIQPTTEFMNNLANLLVSNNRNVPFTCTDGAAIRKEDHSDEESVETNETKISDNKAKKVNEKVKTYTEMCEGFIEEKRFSEALDLALELRTKHRAFLHWSNTKKILYGLVEQNDINGIEKYGTILNNNAKSSLGYKRFLTRCYLTSGNWENYLEKLESMLRDPMNASIKPNNNDIHHGTLVEAYDKHPEYRERFSSIAKDFADREIFAPIGAIWVYHFVNNNPEADDIWSKYLEESNLFFGHTLLDIWEKNHDHDLILRIAEKLSSTKIKRRTKLLIYSEMLAKLLALDDPKKVDTLYSCLTVIANDVTLAHLSKDVLKKAERELAVLGKTSLPSPSAKSVQESASA